MFNETRTEEANKDSWDIRQTSKLWIQFHSTVCLGPQSKSAYLGYI